MNFRNILFGALTSAVLLAVPVMAGAVTLGSGPDTENLSNVGTSDPVAVNLDASHSYDLATICGGGGSPQWTTIYGTLYEQMWDDGAIPNPHYQFLYHITLTSGSDSINEVITQDYSLCGGCSLDVDYFGSATNPAPATASRSTNNKAIQWSLTTAITAGTTSQTWFADTGATNYANASGIGYIFITGSNGNCTVTSTAYYPHT